jgi:polyisoprenoid-binding protein YceI
MPQDLVESVHTIKHMKKVLLVLLLLALIAIGAYAYVTSPVNAPTEDVQTVTDTLRPLDPSQTQVYRISEGSLVEFQMNELLYGKPKLVIGTTTEIAGDIGITTNHIQLGEFKLDARTLITDSAQRNGAINRLILKTGTAGNEYITFKALSHDFVGTIEDGKQASFNATGDLTISGVTKSATFAIKMKKQGDTITGTAETKVKRSDYGLTIPNLSFIANVDDEFLVKVMVIAKKVE